MIQDLREISTVDTAYPAILFFYQGTVEQGEDFFGKFWPEARAVSDENRQFYTDFGIGRGGLREIVGPDVIACGLRSARKGHRLGQVIGDPSVMPGLFVTRGTQVIWQHEFRHIGDHPDLLQIPQLAGLTH